MEPRALNFIDAMRLANILTNGRTRLYQPNESISTFVVGALANISDTDLDYILNLVSPPSYTPDGVLRKILHFVTETGVLELCSSGVLWQD